MASSNLEDSTTLEMVAICVLTKALLHSADTEVPIIVVPTPTPPKGGPRQARHNPKDGSKRTIDELWEAEGVKPQRLAPVSFSELQVLVGQHVHRFHGVYAFRRLACLAPSICSLTVAERADTAVGEASVGKELVIRISGLSLARSFSGATGNPIVDINQMIYDLTRKGWKPPTSFAGKLKNERFWDCLTRIFTFFRILSARYDNKRFAAIGQSLVVSMLKAGRVRSPAVNAWLQSLLCIISGKSNNEVEEELIKLPDSTKAILWRSRRLFNKDDSDPHALNQAAIARMSGPVHITSESDKIAREALGYFQEMARAYLDANWENAKTRHDTAAQHRASATVFASRSDGGGGAELALMVGLHRLSRGQKSRLSDVWGHTSDQISIEEIISCTKQDPIRRREVEEAGIWFTRELDRRGMSYPFITIYPERETKGRTFMLLTYAEQQGGYNAATVLSSFLRSLTDTSEVYKGFDTGRWLQRMREDVESLQEGYVLWLDSKVSTDPLPYNYCMEIFRPFEEVFSEFTKHMLSRIFSPRRVHSATSRAEKILDRLAFVQDLKVSTGLSIQYVRREFRVNHKGREDFRRYNPTNLATLRTVALLPEICSKLRRFRRILLEAPTGSGKTVLSALAFNAIIQFPTVAALLIFSKGLSERGESHNIWYADNKIIEYWDEQRAEPVTILCTAFFVPQLAEKYPSMVVVLDEADAKAEYNLINLVLSKQRGWWTIITTATTEELQGEQSTPRVKLEGGTNFPVTDDECAFEDMLKILKQENTPKSLVIVHSEPLAESLAAKIRQSGKRTMALTAKRRQGSFLEELSNVDVIFSTNAIRSSVTLPVVWVFDCLKVYEEVHFPTEGINSLMLFEASKSMEIQARGRVGRLCPGTYFRVHASPGSAVPYTPKLLGRCDAVSELLGEIPLDQFAREFNIPALIMQRYHSNLARRLGVSILQGAPLWVSILVHFHDSDLLDLIEMVGFEETGIASRTRNLENDLDAVRLYRDFKRESTSNYSSAVKKLVTSCRQQNWFVAEISNVRRWQARFTEDVMPIGNLFSINNLRGLAFALFRSIAKVQSGQLVGCYRSFQCSIPTGWGAIEDRYYIALGVTLFNKDVSARGLISLPQEVVDWIDPILTSEQIVQVAFSPDASIVAPHITWDVVLENKGKQAREIILQYDQYGRHTVFSPIDLERIMNLLVDLTLEKRQGMSTMTTRGSPMSSTASFPVLNSFGLAANEFARRRTKELLRGASAFGDDNAVAGSEEACHRTIEAREALGLQTKTEETFIHHVRSKGEPTSFKGLGVYTERLVTTNFEEVSSLKPMGLIRIFQAYHPSWVFAPSWVPLADYLAFHRQVSRKDPKWGELVAMEKEDVQILHARRETAPRRLIRAAMQRELTPNTRLAEGDVNRLFANLEAAILTVYPSTRGAPDRLENPVEDVLGVPAVSLKTAVELSNILQGEDCFFKLKGPPLQFFELEYAASAAQRVAHARGIETRRPNDAFYSLGWGTGPEDVSLNELWTNPIPEYEQDYDLDDVWGEI